MTPRRETISRRRLALTLCAAAAAPRSPGAPLEAWWPQWRGPDSLGVSAERGLPLVWSSDRNIEWAASIAGSGHSSPIIAGERVFLTSAIEGAAVPGAKAVRHRTRDGGEFLHPDSVGADRSQTLLVSCYHLSTGKLIWRREAYQGLVKDNRHRKNTFASPTPVTDGKHVWVYFGSEGLFCYDLDGALTWSKSLGVIATMGMGVASSPVLYRDLVIVQCDQDNGDESFLAAIEKSTGRTVWRVRRHALESWSSPIIAHHDGRSELIVNAREVIISYDPESGKEFWRSAGMGVNPAPSPVAGHGLVYVTAGAQEKRTVAIRLGRSGEVEGPPGIAWRFGRGAPHVPSPILYGPHFYLMTDNGMLTCLDAATGEAKYQGARLPKPATFSASPVAYEGRILLTSEDGESFVVQAGPVYRLLATNSVGEPVYSSPAIGGGRILIRGERNLYCVSDRRNAAAANLLNCVG